MRKGIWFVAVLLILSLTGCAQKGDSSVSPDTVGESGPETSGLGAEVLEDTTAPETYPMTVAQAVLVDEQGDSWRTTTLSLRQDLLWIDAIRFVDADTVHIEYKAGAADGSFDIGEMNYDTKTGKIVSDTAGRSYALVYAVSPDLAAYRGLEQNSGAYYFINPQNGRVQDSVKTELAGYPRRTNATLPWPIWTRSPFILWIWRQGRGRRRQEISPPPAPTACCPPISPFWDMSFPR